MKKLSTLAALAGALTMTVATVAHAEPKSSSTDKAATPCVGDKCVKTNAEKANVAQTKRKPQKVNVVKVNAVRANQKLQKVNVVKVNAALNNRILI